MRSHYVSQFQLKYFAIPECHWQGSDPKVVVIPLDDRPTFVTSTRNIACERDMYVLDAAGDPQVVEKRLNILETNLAPSLHKLNEPHSLADDERRLIASYIAVQHLRTPAMFTWWGEWFGMMTRCYHLARNIVESPRSNGEECEIERQWREVAEATPADKRRFAARQIIDRGKSLALKLAHRPWAFLRSPAGRFVTASEPIRVAREGDSRNVSIEDDAAIAYWPITPRCALLIGNSGLHEGDYTVDGLEGRLNLWLAEHASFLVTGRHPDDVLNEFFPWFGSGPPSFHMIKAEQAHFAGS